MKSEEILVGAHTQELSREARRPGLRSRFPTPPVLCVPVRSSLTLLVTVEQTSPGLAGQNKHISAFSFPQYNKKKINPKSTFNRIKDFGSCKSQNTKTEVGAEVGRDSGLGREDRETTGR